MVKRYAVITFRGYSMAASYQEAKQAAKRAIDCIADDGFDDSYRWARIVDRNKHLSRLVYRIGGFYWWITPWVFKMS